MIKAKIVCLIAHMGQKDKNGAPYWKHPFAVARGVNGKEEKIVAYLHDVLEDTKVSKSVIRLLFGEDILKHVEAITRGDETYMEYIARVKTDEVARKVKISDMVHNMNLNRIDHPKESDIKRAEKYIRAYDELIH